MSDIQTPGFSEVITFNIYDESDMENSNIIVDNLTQEEREEIANVVSLIDSVNSRELMDFSTQENPTRHKPVSSEELNRLAGKNNAITTKYQTKWALTVLRGIYNNNNNNNNNNSFIVFSIHKKHGTPFNVSAVNYVYLSLLVID